MNFRVEIKNKEASAVAGYIVCGNSDYSITFAFDSEWAALPVKTARFIYTQDDKVQYKDVVFEGVTVQVPILRDITEVFVGVFAGELHTTTPLRIACKKSILCGDDSIQDEPTPDVYAQILELVNTKIVGERELPPVSADDKDKVLAVDENGVWGATEKVAKAGDADYAAKAGDANYAEGAGQAAEAVNADKLDGYHLHDLLPSSAEWIKRTNGLFDKIRLPEAPDDNTYFPVYIEFTIEKYYPQFISIYKNLNREGMGVITPPNWPNRHEFNGESAGASCWLQYEGRSVGWDGNAGYIKTNYNAAPYTNLCLKAETHKLCKRGIVVWLRAGVGCPTEYSLASNYPLSFEVYTEETDIGAEGCPYIVSPLSVPDESLSNYNLGNLKEKDLALRSAFFGYATEAERVGKITPVYPSEKYGGAALDFRADTRSAVYVDVKLGAFLTEKILDDGKTYVYYKYLGNYKFTLFDEYAFNTWSFNYKGKVYEVDLASALLKEEFTSLGLTTSDWVIKCEPGGELATEAVETSVSIFCGTRGAANEPVIVGEAKQAQRADLATKLDFSKKVTARLSPTVTLTEKGLYYFKDYGFVYWDGSSKACTSLTAFPSDDNVMRVYMLEIQANGTVKGYYSSVDENQWLEMENPSSVILDYYKIF